MASKGCGLVGVDGGGSGDGFLNAREKTDAEAVNVGDRLIFTRTGM